MKGLRQVDTPPGDLSRSEALSDCRWHGHISGSIKGQLKE